MSTDNNLQFKVACEYYSHSSSCSLFLFKFLTCSFITLQTDHFIFQICHHSPKISPMGMFEVSPALFPTVRNPLTRPMDGRYHPTFIPLLKETDNSYCLQAAGRCNHHVRVGYCSVSNVKWLTLRSSINSKSYGLLGIATPDE